MPLRAKRHLLLSLAVASFGLFSVDDSSAKFLQPASTQGVVNTEGPLTARVTGVRGVVQVRENETAPWTTAKSGMALPVGGECRTGPRSAIELQIADQRITLDRLGTVRILDAVQSQNRVKTDIGMTYGRVQYKVEAAGSYEHDTTVRSPSSSLAVRGTDVVLYDDGFTSKITLMESQVRAPNVNDDELTMGSGPGDAYYEAYVEMDDDDLSPAHHELEEAATPFLDFPTITPGETGAFVWNNNITSPTGVQEFRFYPYMTSGLSGFGDGDGGNPPPPPPPPPPPNPFPGVLTFNLQWVGNQASGQGIPDLDLFVISPSGERLMPNPKGGSASVPSGGTIPNNNRGGAKQTLGVELARWAKNYPLGTYRYGVRYKGQGDPANYRLIVVQDGRQINTTFDDTVTQFDRKVTFRIRVDAPEDAKKASLSNVKKPAKATRATATVNARTKR